MPSPIAEKARPDDRHPGRGRRVVGVGLDERHAEAVAAEAQQGLTRPEDGTLRTTGMCCA
jgi:hypothetical protein